MCGVDFSTKDEEGGSYIYKAKDLYEQKSWYDQ